MIIIAPSAVYTMFWMKYLHRSRDHFRLTFTITILLQWSIQSCINVFYGPTNIQFPPYKNAATKMVMILSNTAVWYVCKYQRMSVYYAVHICLLFILLPCIYSWTLAHVATNTKILPDFKWISSYLWLGFKWHRFHQTEQAKKTKIVLPNI